MFAGSVGSGFTDKMLDSTYKQLKELQVEESPFVNPPTVIGGRWAGGKSARCFWVKPELVAQVKYLQWTKEGNLRAPVFLGLRDDVDPELVTRERPEPVVDVIDDASERRYGCAGVERGRRCRVGAGAACVEHEGGLHARRRTACRSS